MYSVCIRNTQNLVKEIMNKSAELLCSWIKRLLLKYPFFPFRSIDSVQSQSKYFTIMGQQGTDFRINGSVQE